jgi:hypothetical protein
MVSSDSSDGVMVTQDRTPSGFENSRNVERFNDNCPGEGGSNLVVIAEERNEKLGASVSWTLKTRKRKTRLGNSRTAKRRATSDPWLCYLDPFLRNRYSSIL